MREARHRVGSRTGRGAGFARSDNLPRRWTGAPHQGVVLLVEPTRKVEVDGLEGMRVVLLNAASERVTFPAQDSRLSLVQEALDPDLGLWRPIEYVEPSWCGNSHHTVGLEPGEHWELSAPRYGGPIATQLRLRLGLHDGRALRSAPFAGGVHPGQFVAPVEARGG
jgi:hypothetical protein